MLNLLFKKLGKKNYKIDNSIELYTLFIFIFSKLVNILRGAFYKLFFKKSGKYFFMGKNVKILYPYKITFGNTFTLKDNVRINALSKKGISFGNNVTIQENTIIECTGVLNELGEELIVGNNVGFAPNCFIQVRGKVIIGSNVIFGPGVNIFSENHNFTDKFRFINEQGTNRLGVTINDGVWLASRVTILDGVEIGKNSIIAAGAVVTKDIPENQIWGGVPAKFIKNR